MTWAVAITTYNRPEVLEFTLSQFDKFGGDIVVVDDHSDKKCSSRCIRNSERLGIARSKNKCISLLKEYDKIFLFDDDCFPIKDKWWEIYDKEHHYVHADCPPQYIKKYVGSSAYWNGAMGCAMMIDQETLQRVGGMRKEFGVYGYEHVEFTQRIYKMGLIPYPYITPKNVDEYIWAMDSRGSYNGFKWNGGHNGNHWTGSSVSESDKDFFVKKNELLFSRLSNEVKFIPYDSKD